MNQAGLAEAIVPEGTESAPQPSAIRTRITAYWRDLGLSDPALMDSLTDDCLNRARRRMGRGSEEELLRRALEEVQRRFDHALARALRLPPSGDPQPIAAARAAFLLSENRLSADRLFQPGDPAFNLGPQLQETLPRSTPPEAPLSMSEAPLRFWLFKSPPH